MTFVSLRCLFYEGFCLCLSSTFGGPCNLTHHWESEISYFSRGCEATSAKKWRSISSHVPLIYSILFQVLIFFCSCSQTIIHILHSHFVLQGHTVWVAGFILSENKWPPKDWPGSNRTLMHQAYWCLSCGQDIKLQAKFCTKYSKLWLIARCTVFFP